MLALADSDGRGACDLQEAAVGEALNNGALIGPVAITVAYSPGFVVDSAEPVVVETLNVPDPAGPISISVVYTQGYSARSNHDAYGRQTVLDASGNTLAASSIIGQVYGFTGRRLDLETGLEYFRARMYSHILGRFIQRDPYCYVDGESLYFAYYIPNQLDPNGLDVSQNPKKKYEYLDEVYAQDINNKDDPILAKSISDFFKNIHDLNNYKCAKVTFYYVDNDNNNNALMVNQFIQFASSQKSTRNCAINLYFGHGGSGDEKIAKDSYDQFKASINAYAGEAKNADQKEPLLDYEGVFGVYSCFAGFYNEEAGIYGLSPMKNKKTVTSPEFLPMFNNNVQAIKDRIDKNCTCSECNKTSHVNIFFSWQYDVAPEAQNLPGRNQRPISLDP
jgi:RHS repeat-associated protein